VAKETSQTLDRGLSVLEVLAEFPEGLSVTELSHKLGVGRTVVYRLVVTLEAHSLLRRSTDGKCRLGLGLLSLARVIQPLVREASGPALRMLAEALSCTAYLMIADVNDGLVALVSEPNRSDMHVSIRIGTRSPLEGSAGGRAILAARTALADRLTPRGWLPILRAARTAWLCRSPELPGLRQVWELSRLANLQRLNSAHALLEVPMK